QIRADADGGHRQIGRLRGHEGAEIVDVGGTEQNIRWSSGAKPDEVLEARFFGVAAAYGRQRRMQGGRHALASRDFNAASSPAAHPVMDPAPRQMMAPPGRASDATRGVKSSAPSIARTCLCPCRCRPSTSESRLTP